MKFIEAEHPGTSTWNLKITHLKRKNMYRTFIFGFHVKFRGCTIWTLWCHQLDVFVHKFKKRIQKARIWFSNLTSSPNASSGHAAKNRPYQTASTKYNTKSTKSFTFPYAHCSLLQSWLVLGCGLLNGYLNTKANRGPFGVYKGVLFTWKSNQVIPVRPLNHHRGDSLVYHLRGFHMFHGCWLCMAMPCIVLGETRFSTCNRLKGCWTKFRLGMSDSDSALGLAKDLKGWKIHKTSCIWHHRYGRKTKKCVFFWESWPQG